ncbi:hypothetical protein PVK06_035397 [Gossypium arboreum]|uniref:Uncharacterized protein n=1 Tax=Gossypium arboreum TaxID=29729 RepID=A0ABR0NGQ2_GOSAR|nr:hypothetical protein PVK06_035397 [Gossypium arboreum]
MLKKCLKKSALFKEKKPVGKALCWRKSVIEGNDGTDKKSKKLGLSKGKAEAKRAKRSKKKRVKCLLYRGSHELQNCPKQTVVKGKETSELVKLGPMRLNLSEALELAESSTRLPPMGNMGVASDFKEKEVMQVGQLTRVNAMSRMVRVKKRRKSRKKSRRKGEAKALR